MTEIENRMVVDEQWEWQNQDCDDDETEEEKGYINTSTNEVIYEDEAYEYALDQCLNGTEEMQKEFKEMLVEWFYSNSEWMRKG